MAELANFRLPARLRRLLATAAPVVLTDEVTEQGLTDDVVDGVELFLRSIPRVVRGAIVAGMFTFEHSARAVPSSLGRPFSELPPDLAAAHFERYWHSRVGPLHQLARAIKMFLAFAYYEHPRVREQLGYDPEVWIEKVKRERAERFAEEIAAAEAAVLAPDPLVGGRERVDAQA
jgi:hypothetical protein